MKYEPWEGCFIRRPEDIEYLDELQQFDFVARLPDVLPDPIDKQLTLWTYFVKDKPLNTLNVIKYFTLSYEEGFYPPLEVLSFLYKAFDKYFHKMANGENISLDEVFGLSFKDFKAATKDIIIDNFLEKYCCLKFYFNIKQEECFGILCESNINNKTDFNFKRELSSNAETIKDWYKNNDGPKRYKRYKEFHLEKWPYLTKEQFNSVLSCFSEHGQFLIKKHSKNPRIK